MIRLLHRGLLAARRRAGSGLDALRRAHPARRRAARENAALRRTGVALLDRLSREGAPAPRYRRVLVDGMWDNPNYWTRYALLRQALGLAGAEEHGLLGEWNRQRVTTTLQALGITGLRDFHIGSAHRRRHMAAARTMAASIGKAGDAMALAWPEDFPAEIAYDGIIRRQRRGDVDPADPMLADHIAEALACLAAARDLLDRGDYDLLVLSHAINFDFGALAWCAQRRGIDVVIAYGNYGSNRFLRIDGPDALDDFSNVPDRARFDGTDPDGFALLRAKGRTLMADRLGGATDDIGAVYAFQKTTGGMGRERVVAELGLDAARPVICVYASNWFDFPHGAPMVHFRDFRDWIDATLAVAAATPEVNWLFRPHPCDTWYGAVNGPTLADLVAATAAPHVHLVPADWNGAELMGAIDGGITYFGTVAVELAAAGKPALLADRGWYGHLGFARLPESRQDYLGLLAAPWWQDMDLKACQARAEAFAGWWFAMPDWLEPMRLRDDSNQEAIWQTLPAWLEGGREAIGAEIATIADWMAAGERHLNVYRWSRALEAQTARRSNLAAS